MPTDLKIISLISLILTLLGTLQMSFQAFGSEQAFKDALRFYLEYMPKADAVPDGKRNSKTFPPEYRKADRMLSLIVWIGYLLFIGLPLWSVHQFFGGGVPGIIYIVITTIGLGISIYVVLGNSGTRVVASILLYFEHGNFYDRMTALGLKVICSGLLLQALVVVLS